MISHLEPFWQDRPTLVTGATGQLGSWLVRHLLKANADVVCLIRDWVPQSDIVRSGLIDSVRVVRGDITDQSLLERLLSEYEIRTVLHMAAQSIIGTAVINPVGTFDTNIRGTWILLEACRRSPNVQQIVIASTDKSYGESETLPYVEEMPLRAEYPHDVSKACADMIANCYAATYGTPVIGSRLPNIYGGGDLNWNRLVPGTIRSLLRGEAPVIYSDGSNIRDYLYVEDAALAHMLLAERLEQQPELRGEFFNLSDETRMTVLEFVRKLISRVGLTLEPQILNKATKLIKHQYLSAAKAKARLGWEPRFSLDEGLQLTIAWYQSALTSEGEHDSLLPITR